MKKLWIYPFLATVSFLVAGVLAYFQLYVWMLIPGAVISFTLLLALCAVIHQQRAVAVLIQTQTQLLIQVLRSSGVEVEPTSRG